MNRLLLIVIVLFQCISLISQEKEQQNLSTGVLTLNHSYTISNRYQLKSSIEQRLPFVFLQLPFFTDKVRARTDVTTGLQRKLNTSFSTAVGGMFRFINGTTEQRLYQQLGYVQQTLTRFKVVHRLRIDQTFSSDPFENRIRYRVGAELPRRGFRTDPGEQYVAVLSEFLAKSQGGAFIPELRVASQFGFLFKNSNKGELQIEVRINDVGRKVQENLFLLGLSYYFTK